MLCFVAVGEGISISRILLCCEHQQWDRITKQNIQMPRKKKLTLSSIITLIVEVFFNRNLPKIFIPELHYLHNRPKTIISHCLERREKALKYTTEDITLIDNENGIFSVKGTSGKDHNISFGLPSCSCRDWITRHVPCKHFFAIFSYPLSKVELE